MHMSIAQSLPGLGSGQILSRRPSKSKASLTVGVPNQQTAYQIFTMSFAKVEFWKT